MSGHAYTEDQLVEQPAIGLFTKLGWTTVAALEGLNPRAVARRHQPAGIYGKWQVSPSGEDTVLTDT